MTVATKPRYEWKDGCRLGGDAVSVGREIDRIRKKYKGLDPVRVVEEARPKTSPLHRYFEWDDSRAAEHHRLQQARMLIASITIVELPKQIIPIRAFVKTVEKGRTGYEATTRIMSNKDSRKLILARAYQELQTWKERYESYQEFAKVVAAIKQLPRL